MGEHLTAGCADEIRQHDNREEDKRNVIRVRSARHAVVGANLLIGLHLLQKRKMCDENGRPRSGNADAGEVAPAEAGCIAVTIATLA